MGNEVVSFGLEFVLMFLKRVSHVVPACVGLLFMHDKILVFVKKEFDFRKNLSTYNTNQCPSFIGNSRKVIYTNFAWGVGPTLEMF